MDRPGANGGIRALHLIDPWDMTWPMVALLAKRPGQPVSVRMVAAKSTLHREAEFGQVFINITKIPTGRLKVRNHHRWTVVHQC